MVEDYSEEIRELIKKHKKEDIKYAKPLDYLLHRNNLTKEQIEKDLFSCDNLNKVIKQERNEEIRYLLYFVYTKKRGRAYVLHLNERLVIITIYPLGKKTLSKYVRRRFIK